MEAEQKSIVSATEVNLELSVCLLSNETFLGLMKSAFESVSQSAGMCVEIL